MESNANEKNFGQTAPTGTNVPDFGDGSAANGPKSMGPSSMAKSSSLMRTAPPAPVAAGHPLLDVVRGELERHFSLEELFDLSTGALGFEPDLIGGNTAKASFCKALVDFCAERDAIEALADAVVIARTDIDPRVREIASVGLASSDELLPGTEVGLFTITRKLGEGGAGRVYAAHVREPGGGTRPVTLKLLRREVARDMRSLQRYLTANRLVGTLDHESLPRNLGSGQLDDGRFYIMYDFIEGQVLAARLQRTGPMHLNEAKPILRGLLEGLRALHDKRLAHGDLTTDNVLLARVEGTATPKVYLLDFGTDRLRPRGRSGLNQTGVLAVYGSAKAMAPELVRGHAATAKSDVYAFGTLLFEVLTGKGPFHKEGASSLEIALAHLSQPAPAPSATSPRGWVSKELDTFVAELLQKDPSSRPNDAKAVLEALDKIGKAAATPEVTTTEAAAPKLSDDDVDTRIAELVDRPGDPEAATALEKAIADGGDPIRIADGFQQVAEMLDSDEHKDLRRALCFRAARIFESAAKNPDRAEGAYKRLLELYPHDDIAHAAYEEMKKATGQWHDLVELLLARVETVDHGRERALVYAEIGRVFEIEQEDPDNAFIAFVQAWCEEPRENGYAGDVERLAGTSSEKWDEALGQASHKVTVKGVSNEDKLALFTKMGAWFISKVNRLDLALPSYQSAIALDPANDEALEGLADVYRRAQQWPELGAMLLKRADAAATPAKARDLRAQAAELLETKLSDAQKAKEIYQAIVDADPGHSAATEGLERICARTGDYAGVVKILETRANSLRGRDKADALARIGELFEDNLGDLVEAQRRFEAVLAIDPRHLGALKGLDRIYNRTGRYKDLLANLQTQVEAAATPRQKIGLFERIAAIHDEEFLDHAAAAEAYEAIVKIDSSHEAALSALVRHYRSLDRWEDVVTVYDRHLKAVEQPARRVELLLARGRILAEQIGSPERAMSSYEKVLELNSEHAGALEALARLRETAGDASSAVAAVEALAAKATTPEAKAEQYVRAARLLEGRGDKDGAIERYKLALEANPNDKGAAAALRAAYAVRGDTAAAIAMIEREVVLTDGKLQKARLYAEMALIARDRMKNIDRARDAASKALDHDPTNATALMVLGDLAFEAERFVEAAQRFEAVNTRVESLPKADAVR
ncbi:MAG: protein kinase, partial [Polyangiales bacterium]